MASTALAPSEVAALFNAAFAPNYRIGAVDVDDLVFTNDTIDNFLTARKSWSSGGTLVAKSATHLFIEDAQALKGQRRRTLCIIDLGDCRAVYED